MTNANNRRRAHESITENDNEIETSADADARASGEDTTSIIFNPQNRHHVGFWYEVYENYF